MLAPFDNLQLRILRPCKQLDFLLRVRNRVHRIRRTLRKPISSRPRKPQNEGEEKLTCIHNTGALTSHSRPCSPSRSRKLILAMRALSLPSSPRYRSRVSLTQKSRSAASQSLPSPRSTSIPRYPSSRTKSGVGVSLVHPLTSASAIGPTV